MVTFVYTMTVVAFHTTLSVPEVLGAEAVAVVSWNAIIGKFPKSRFIYHKIRNIYKNSVLSC